MATLRRILDLEHSGRVAVIGSVARSLAFLFPGPARAQWAPSAPNANRGAKYDRFDKPNSPEEARESIEGGPMKLGLYPSKTKHIPMEAMSGHLLRCLVPRVQSGLENWRPRMASPVSTRPFDEIDRGTTSLAQPIGKRYGEINARS